MPTNIKENGFETLIVDCLRGLQLENCLEEIEQGLVLLRST